MKNMFKKLRGLFLGLTLTSMLCGCSGGTGAVIQNRAVQSLDESGEVLNIQLPEKEKLGTFTKAVNRLATSLLLEFELTDGSQVTVPSMDANLVEGKALIDNDYLKAVAIEEGDPLKFSGLENYYGSIYYGSKYYRTGEGNSRIYTTSYAEAYDEEGKLKEGYTIATQGRVLKLSLDLLRLTESETSDYYPLRLHEFKITATPSAYAELVPGGSSVLNLHFDSETSKFAVIEESDITPEKPETPSVDETSTEPELSSDPGETIEPLVDEL